MINYKKEYYVSLNYAAVCVKFEYIKGEFGYESHESKIIKVALRDAVNELKISSDSKCSVVRHTGYYGMFESQRIYLVDDTIFDIDAVFF